MTKVSISGAWDETRAVLARDGKLISSVALALLVLPGVVGNVILPSSIALGSAQQGTQVLLAVIVLMLTFIGQLSVFRLAMGPHISVGESIRHAATRALPFFAAFLLWVIPFLILGSIAYAVIRTNPTAAATVTRVGILAIMALAIFIAIRLLLIGPVAIAEEGGALKILRRSWDLTEGNWWRLFGFVFVFAIGGMALILAVNYGLGLLARIAIGQLTQRSVAGVLVSLVSQIVTAGTYVVLFVMQARIYTQLAAHRETSARAN